MSLPYAPLHVCCSADYIFVYEHGPRAVHVHSWTGLHIQTLSHQQLGVKEIKRISAIGCSNDGTVLQLATDDTLHACKVRCTFISPYTMHGCDGSPLLSESEVNNISAIKKSLMLPSHTLPDTKVTFVDMFIITYM